MTKRASGAKKKSQNSAVLYGAHVPHKSPYSEKKADGAAGAGKGMGGGRKEASFRKITTENVTIS